MTLSRLLAAALLICSPFACAQHQQASRIPASSEAAPAFARDSEATPGEPWLMVSNLSPDRNFEKKLTDADQARADAGTLHFKPAGEYGLVLRSDAADADLTCYTIRRYLVARDSKDSDSTHPAGYSTCLPSDRYQVKTTEMRVVER